MDKNFEVHIFLKKFVYFFSNLYPQCGAQAHDLEIKSSTLPMESARHSKGVYFFKTHVSFKKKKKKAPEQHTGLKNRKENLRRPF